MDKIKVLVVDDKRIIGDLFDITLGYSGHDITVVQDGAEAVRLAKDGAFDIAFIDIVMPDPDGVAVLQQIKEVAPKLPVVMMSGYSVEERRHKAMQLGAITCLKKPFEMDEVREVVKKAIGKNI